MSRYIDLLQRLITTTYYNALFLTGRSPALLVVENVVVWATLCVF
jgi:hypothetical protein